MTSGHVRFPYLSCKCSIKSFDFRNLSLYYECLRSITPANHLQFPSRKTTLRLDRYLLRSPATTKAWLILTAVLMLCLLPVPAEIPTAAPQIQAANLRVLFDNRLRRRVVARLEKTETVLGPFTASETVTTVERLWIGFYNASQKLT